MAGLLNKALAGAAVGGQQAVQVGMRDYLLQEQARLESERQARQNEWQAGENEKTRALTERQISETERSHKAGEDLRGREIDEQFRRTAAQLYLGGKQDERAREQIKNETDRTKAYTALASVQARLGKLNADAQQEITAMQKEYADPKTTPQRKDQLADSLLTLLGKTKYAPVVGKDEMGNPQYLGAFDARRGIFTREGGAQKPGEKSGVPWDQFLGGGPTRTASQPLIGDRIVPSGQQPEQRTGPSAEEVDSMIDNAKRGYQPAIQYLQDAISKNTLTLEQRLRAREALGGR